MKPLSKIIFYPVKAFGGQSVESCEIENNRIKYDRIFGFRFAKADEFLDYKWKNKHNFVKNKVRVENKMQVEKNTKNARKVLRIPVRIQTLRTTNIN